MGLLENKVTTNRKRVEIQKLILGSIAVAGILSLSAIVPNVFVAMKNSGILDTGKRRKELINRSLDRLLNSGLLSKNENGFIRLTKKGEAKLRQLEIDEFMIPRPKKWDGKWRVLIFDIPEKRKLTRDKIRNTLNALGFFRLQDSVWIFPFECEDLIALLKVDFKIGKDLLYMIVEEIEGANRLLSIFGLQK